MTPLAHTALASGMMIAIETALIVWAARGDTPYRLRGLTVINMLLIALFARALLDTGAGISNITNICFASIVCCQCIVLAKHGIHAQRATILMVNYSMTCMFALTYAVSQFPVVPGNEAFMRAMSEVCRWTYEIAAASFVAFFASQEALWRCWHGYKSRFGAVLSMLLASWACQAVDTPVFFTIAFLWREPTAWIIEAAATGFMVKCGLAVAFVPAFVLATSQPVARLNGNGSVSTQM